MLSILLAATLLAPVPYCETYLGAIMDSDDNCDASHLIRRTIGVQSFLWGTKQMLMVNVGNELRLYDLSTPNSPQQPDLIGESSINVVIHTDKNQNLIEFGVGNDARFVPAAFGQEGSALVDLGTGSSPSFTSDDYWTLGTAQTNVGGFGFEHNGSQYLIGGNLPTGCAGGSTIYLATGIDAEGLAPLHCLSYFVSRGWYFEQNGTGFLYLASEWGMVTAYSFVGSPASLTSHGSVGSNFAVDVEAEMGISSSLAGTTLWDLSDGVNPVAYPTNPSFMGNIVAIRYPLAFVGISPMNTMGKLIDISDPSNTVEADPGFWSDPAATWNQLNCAVDFAADFSMDGSTLYFARYSVLQKVDVTGCIAPPPPPEVFSDGFESGNLSGWPSGFSQP